MDEMVELAEVDLSTKQQLGKVLFAATVAFGASKLAERTFTEAVKAIRNRKAAQ